MSRKDQIQAQIAALQAELDALADRLPEPKEGPAVVFFNKTWGKADRSYSYVGVRTQDGWYVSTSDGRVRKPNGRLSWDDLVDFIDQAELDEPAIGLATRVDIIREGK